MPDFQKMLNDSLTHCGIVMQANIATPRAEKGTFQENMVNAIAADSRLHKLDRPMDSNTKNFK